MFPDLRTVHFGKSWTSLTDGRPGEFANDLFEYLETQSICPSLGVLILGMYREIDDGRLGENEHEERLNNSEAGPAHSRSFQNRRYYKRARKFCDGVWRAVGVPVKLSWLEDNETELDILDYNTCQAWPAGSPAWRRDA